MTIIRFSAVLVAAVLLSACANSMKSGAKDAKDAAEKAVKDLEKEASQFAPDKLREMTKVLENSNTDFECERYADVMLDLKDFLSKSKELRTEIDASKHEAERNWDQYKRQMPDPELDKSVESAAKDPKSLTSWAENKLIEMKKLWGEAERLEREGKLADALAKAKQANEVRRMLMAVVMPGKQGHE